VPDGGAGGGRGEWRQSDQRVVPVPPGDRSDGSLTGYGGGIERKRWLLQHEGAAFREVVARAA